MHGRRPRGLGRRQQGLWEHDDRARAAVQVGSRQFDAETVLVGEHGRDAQSGLRVGAELCDVVTPVAGHHLTRPGQPLVLDPQSGIVHDEEGRVRPVLQGDVYPGVRRRVPKRVVQQHRQGVDHGFHGPALDREGLQIRVLDALIALDPAHGRADDVGQCGRRPASRQLVAGQDAVPGRGEQHLLGQVVHLDQRGVRLVRDMAAHAGADRAAQLRGPLHGAGGEGADCRPGHVHRLLPRLGDALLGFRPDLRDLVLRCVLGQLAGLADGGAGLSRESAEGTRHLGVHQLGRHGQVGPVGLSGPGVRGSGRDDRVRDVSGELLGGAHLLPELFDVLLEAVRAALLGAGLAVEVERRTGAGHQRGRDQDQFGHQALTRIGGTAPVRMPSAGPCCSIRGCGSIVSVLRSARVPGSVDCPGRPRGRGAAGSGQGIRSPRIPLPPCGREGRGNRRDGEIRRARRFAPGLALGDSAWSGAGPAVHAGGFGELPRGRALPFPAGPEVSCGAGQAESADCRRSERKAGEVGMTEL